MTRPLPEVSVVVNTYNRASQVGDAIQSALSQAGVDLEVVVVDDGSTDDTKTVLARVADPRMRFLHQTNRGLSASRNVGAREARGKWVLFLDDDDRLCEGALKALLTATAERACRVVVGGVRFVDSTGRVLNERSPASLADALAGTFLIGRSLFHDAGAYLEGMPCSHQTEFFIRVSRVLGNSRGVISYVAEPVVEIERRSATGRPEQSPAHTYFGARWLLARHQDWYGNGRPRAALEGLLGVNAVRIGRQAEARRRLAAAIRHDPLSPRRYLQLAGAVVPAIGRRFWLRQWDLAPATPRLLDRVRRQDDNLPHLALERDPNPGPDSLFIPWRYRENPPNSSGVERRPLSARLIHPNVGTPAVGIGYGSGRGMLRCGKVLSIARDGQGWTWMEGDLDDESVWDEIASLRPQLVTCFHVVERVFDPRRLLSGIHRAVGQGGRALISTPDRSRQRPKGTMGPPTSPLHVREWSSDEFALLLESCGFEILRLVHRSPRTYSPAVLERKSFLSLPQHLKASACRRSSMEFLVQATGERSD